LDAAKGLLIFLVVMGHALPGGSAVTEFIYLFHMPAFVFISGVLTRDAPLSAARVDGLLRRLLAPLLIFQALYIGFELLAPGGAHLEAETLFTPRWPLWFLAALLAWRLLSPVLRRVRGVLAYSVALCLAIGTVELPQMFSINYILAFLPFFVLGLHLEPTSLRKLRHPAVRAGSVLVLLGAGWVTWAIQDLAPLRPWFELSHSYQSLHVSAADGIALKFLQLVVSALVMCAVLSLAPTRTPSLITAGVYSMYPYLLHRFAVKAHNWWWPESGWNGNAQVMAIAAASVGFTLFTLTPPVRRVFRKLVEPDAGWLVRGSDRRAGRGRSRTRDAKGSVTMTP
jgi:fucose 4-O-acetylase-like acetyltransferase